MEATSQIMENGRYYRVCNSCLRNLNVCEFGLLWNGREGFNSTCKACRREIQKDHYRKSYQRKRSYHTQMSDFICSLDRHNQAMLWASVQKSTVSIAAFSLSDGGAWAIEIRLNVLEDSIQLELFAPNGKRDLALKTSASSWETLMDCFLVELRRRALRIRPPTDSLVEAEFFRAHVPKTLTTNCL